MHAPCVTNHRCRECTRVFPLCMTSHKCGKGTEALSRMHAPCVTDDKCGGCTKHPTHACTLPNMHAIYVANN